MKTVLALLALLLFFHITAASAAESYRTVYTSVHYDSIRHFNAFESAVSPIFHWVRGPSSDYLSSKIDRIVEDVEFFLDMYPMNFKVDIVVLGDHEKLQRKYKVSGRDKQVLAFFQQSSKTIYISSEDVTPKILTHEITHAVISEYFKGAAPTKTQEILAIAADEELEE